MFMEVSIASSSANSFRREIVSLYGMAFFPSLNRFFPSEQFPAAVINNATDMFMRVSIASSSANSFRQGVHGTVHHCHRGSLNRFFLSEQFPAGAGGGACSVP